MEEVNFSQRVLDYVEWRVKELTQKDLDYFKKIAALYQETFKEKPTESNVTSDNERTGFWLHHCGEWRVQKLREEAAKHARR